MPLVTVKVSRTSDACPFLNPEVSFTLEAGQILWLKGASGAGKSLTCYALAGLSTLPGATLEATWDENVPEKERIGFLFQKGVLLDALNLAENIALSLRASGQPHPTEAINAALAAVGLNGAVDGAKMPGEVRASSSRPAPPISHAHVAPTSALTRLRACFRVCASVLVCACRWSAGHV